MSTHLLIAAAYLEDLDPTVKLVLMAVADSADEHTLEAAPGLPKLRAWSGRSKSQVTRIVTDLEDAKLVERVTAGRLGRRAVYRVFPLGVPAIPHPDEVRDRYVPNVETDQGYPQETPETGAHPCAPRGASTHHQGRTHAPPSYNPSVHKGTSPHEQHPRRVDNAPPARSTGSGFPGSRATALEEREEARRARGAMDRPCPVGDHGRLGEVNGACGRCAHAAANADPETVATARKQAREALTRARTATSEETPTP